MMHITNHALPTVSYTCSISDYMVILHIIIITCIIHNYTYIIIYVLYLSNLHKIPK